MPYVRKRFLANKVMKKGGKILAQGADTCVFEPEVACTGNKVAITGDTQGPFISRIIPEEEHEHINQRNALASIKADLQNDTVDDQNDVLAHFLFGSFYCTPNTTDDDFRDVHGYSDCNFDDGDRVISRHNKPNNPQHVNIITPKYKGDIANRNGLIRSKEDTKGGLYNLMAALTFINKEHPVVHFDAHPGNLGWKNNRIVLSDWGRVVFHQEECYLSERYEQSFKQFFYPIKLLKKLNRFNIFYKMTKDVAVVWDILAITKTAEHFGLVTTSNAETFLNTVVSLVQRAGLDNTFSMDLRDELIHALRALFGYPPVVLTPVSSPTTSTTSSLNLTPSPPPAPAPTPVSSTRPIRRTNRLNGGNKTRKSISKKGRGRTRRT